MIRWGNEFVEQGKSIVLLKWTEKGCSGLILRAE